MIQIYPDYEQLSLAAAKCFVEESQKAIAKHGRFSVVLSGGHTPQHTYEILAQPPFKEEVSWQQTHVFWGDERCVPPEDSLSNIHMAKQALLNHIPIPASNIHPMQGNLNLQAAAQSYEKEIQQFFHGQKPQFDLIFLGLGDNGHTASLFPFLPALHETQKWVAAVYVAEQDMHRLTMTVSLLNQGRKIVFLVSGSEKASIFSRMLDGAYDPDALPAQLIRPVDGELLWLVDQDAATLCKTCREYPHATKSSL